MQYVGDLRGHEGWVVSMDMGNPHGGPLVCLTGADDGTAKVWSQYNAPELMTLEGHQKNVTAVRLAGDFAVTASLDGTCGVWDMEGGQRVLTLGDGTSPITLMDAKDNLVATCGYGGIVRLYDRRTGTRVRIGDNKFGGRRIIKFTKDGHHIVSAMTGRGVTMMDVGTSMESDMLGYDFTDGQQTMYVGESNIITGDVHDVYRIWDLESGELTAKTEETFKLREYLSCGKPPGLMSVSGDYMYTTYMNHQAEMYCSKTLKPLGIFCDKAVSVKAKCKIVLVGCFDGVVRVFKCVL